MNSANLWGTGAELVWTEAMSRDSLHLMLHFTDSGESMGYAHPVHEGASPTDSIPEKYRKELEPGDLTIPQPKPKRSLRFRSLSEQEFWPSVVTVEHDTLMTKTTQPLTAVRYDVVFPQTTVTYRIPRAMLTAMANGHTKNVQIRLRDETHVIEGYKIRERGRPRELSAFDKRLTKLQTRLETDSGSMSDSETQ